MYHNFSMKNIKETYLGIKNLKSEQAFAKIENKLKEEIPISCIKSENKK